MFIFHLGAYALFVAPICVDNLVDFRLTENIAQSAHLNVNGLDGPLRQYLTREDGAANLLPKRGIGQGLLQVPFYMVGDAIGRLSPREGARRDAAAFAVAMFNPTVTAATVTLLFLFCINLQYTRRVSLIVAIVYGFASSAFVFAEYNWNSVSAAFTLLTSFYLLRRNTQRPSRCSVVFSGFVAGCALFIRADIVVIVPVLALYLCLSNGRRAEGDRLFTAALRSLALFVVPVAFCILGLLWFNQIAFGNILTTGYGNDPWHYAQIWRKAFPQNARGILIGAQSGILVYSPIAVIACLGLPLFFKKHAREGIAVVALMLGMFGFYSLFWPVASTSCFEWGNRFMFPALCVAMLPLAPVTDRILASRPLRIVAIPLLVMFLGIQTLGATQFLYRSSVLAAYLKAKDVILPPERMRIHARELFAGHHNIWWIGGYADLTEFAKDLPDQGAGIPPALPVTFPCGWFAVPFFCAIVASGAYLVEATRLHDAPHA